jgi:putative redox protein
MPSSKASFEGAFGDTLSAKLDWPEAEVNGWVLFAHGFSIGKDLKPIRTISQTLVRNGYGMMRFDFTGLGQSGGNFSDTNFSSNCEDLRNAAGYLRAHYEAPKILIGHSFGGTAALKLVDELPEVGAIATIGSPCDTTHIVHQFADQLTEIEEEGEAKVLLGGRPFVIKEQFLEDIGNQDIASEIRDMDTPLMIFHSPQDRVVSIQNASHIYSQAKHPKSFVSLDGADHLLLKNPADAVYIANVIAAWAGRYI